MSKPFSLRYPRDLIKKAERRLRLKLREIAKAAIEGELPKVEARDQGAKILEEHYKAQIDAINAFAKSKGLAGLTGYEGFTQDALDEAKARWKLIIEDIQPEGAV